MQAIEYKIALIGHSNTGKTSFVKNLLYGLYNDMKPTLGVDVYPYDITYNEKKYRINFWDCAGNEEYMGLGKDYVTSSNMVLIFKSNNFNNEVFQSWIPTNTPYEYITYNNTDSIVSILSIIKNKLLC